MLRNGDSKLEISFLLLNNNKQVIHFFLSHPSVYQQLFIKAPQIGLPFEEIISPKHNVYLSYLIKKSINDQSLIVDSIVNDNLNTLLFFIPVAINEDLVYTVFTAVEGVPNTHTSYHNSSYAKFTSHVLRSPISNLIALSDPKNHNSLNLYTDLKVKELLNTIYGQATKLNDIVSTLNVINSFNEEEVQSYPVLSSPDVSSIMMVDDDAIANKLHQHLLKKLLKQTNVVAFDYAEDALACLEHKHFDLIFLDINMPHVNGWMFLDKMMKMDVKTNVVMVTSSKDPQERQKAMTYDVVKAFVSKPLSSDTIKAIFNINTP